MAELILTQIICTLPFHIFAYVPFWNHLRFSKKKTAVIISLEPLVFMAVFYWLLRAHIPYEYAELTCIPFYGSLFFFLVKMDWEKIAFLYIFTTDYLMLVKSLASYLLLLLPHDPAARGWTLAALTQLLFFAFFPFMLRYFCQTAEEVFAIHAPEIWKTMWILPLFNSLIVLFYTFPISVKSQTDAFRSTSSRCILMCCIFIIYRYIVRAIHQLQQETADKERIESLEGLVKIQAGQYTLLQSQMEEIRRARHDLRQHLKAIQGCIESGDLGLLSSYVTEYGESIPVDLSCTYCKNSAIDALLRFYAEKAKQAGISTDIAFGINEKLRMPEPEFCVMLGNLLENALDACMDVDGERFIRVRAKQTDEGMLTFAVDNTSKCPPATDGDKFRSSKHIGNGIGTDSVRMIAGKYNGDARFRWEAGVFYASVMLDFHVGDGE